MPPCDYPRGLGAALSAWPGTRAERVEESDCIAAQSPALACGLSAVSPDWATDGLKNIQEPSARFERLRRVSG